MEFKRLKDRLIYCPKASNHICIFTKLQNILLNFFCYLYLQNRPPSLKNLWFVFEKSIRNSNKKKKSRQTDLGSRDKKKKN